jgi:hypothetical protein
LLAERASQKPPKGAQEHAARNDPTIRRVLRPHMAYERGAFKVNCCIALNGLLHRLQRRNIYAGNLAKASYLHKKQTVCRLGIHFYRLIIRRNLMR